MVKHFKQYSLERKGIKPSGYQGLNNHQLLQKLHADADEDDPKMHRLIVSNAVDLDSRHMRRMLEKGVENKMMAANDEGSS
jgi:hypothetical protein